MSRPSFEIILALAAALVMTNCGNRYKTIETRVIASERAKRVDDTLMKDPGTHFYYSRLRKPSSFGLLFDYNLPETSLGKELCVVVKGRTRTNYAQSGAVLVVVAHEGKEQRSWMFIPLKHQYRDVNTWCAFKDSLRLPADFDGRSYDNITVAAHLTTSTKENFDMDSLYIFIKQKD